MDQIYRNKQLGPKAAAWQDKAFIFLTAETFQTPVRLAQLYRLEKRLSLFIYSQKSWFDILYVSSYKKTHKITPTFLYLKTKYAVNFILGYKYYNAFVIDNN